jgi:hypothetical protein
MGRVITVDGTGTERNRLRRTIAEALRLLGQKEAIDDEARDLAALIVYSLRQIAQGVDTSAKAWEKRDYYMKADRFRSEWEWVDRSVKELEDILRQGRWNHLSVALAKLIPRFSDIKLTKMTRSPDLWHGCYQRFLKEGVREKAIPG